MKIPKQYTQSNQMQELQKFSELVDREKHRDYRFELNGSSLVMNGAGFISSLIMKPGHTDKDTMELVNKAVDHVKNASAEKLRKFSAECGNPAFTKHIEDHLKLTSASYSEC